MSNVQFWFKLQNMAQGELLEHVDPDELEEIRKEHGAIEAYGIAHEGISKTTVVGEKKSKFLRWMGDIVDYIKDAVKPNTPIWYMHNTDNSTTGRKAIGKVLKTIKTATGEVVSIVRRFADSLNLKCDVASFEAPLNTTAQELSGHVVRPWELGEITGIALANSLNCKPAFERAVRTAYVQMFETKETSTMELSEILAAKQEQKITPLQIFSPEEIFELEPVKEAIAARKGNQNLYDESQRYKSELAVARGTHQEELKKMTDQLATQKAEVLKYQVMEKYGSQLKKRENLTPGQLQYIELENDRLTIDPEKGIEEQINGHLDATLKRYEAVEKVLIPGQQKDVSTGLPKPEPQQAVNDEMKEMLAYLPS